MLAAAREWERHIVEITTGVAPEGIARPEYDPAARTQIERDRAKAAELAAAGRPLGVRTLQRMRGRYAEQGLWGLVDQRVLRECEPTGRVDERVVAVVRQELDAQTDVSTGTRSRLIRRVRKSLEDTYGPGVVRPTATKVNVIPTTWRRLRIIRAELTIGGKAVRSWQASHEP